jgi:peptide/nickel transport system permease protein
VTLDLAEKRLPAWWRFGHGWSDIYYAFTQRKPAVFGAVLFSIIIVLALAAPYVAPHSPTSQQLRLSLSPPFWDARSHPDYPLGADHFGRDVLSRLLHGAQVSLRAGGFAALFSMVLGVFVGIVSGYWGGWIENLLMRIVDVFLAFPLILLALSLASILGPSLRNIIIVMALTGWMMYARVIRSAVLSLKDREFIGAAVVMGATTSRILLIHILPNVIAPSIVLFTFNFAQFIIMESALSFLGLGVPPPAPTWGRMLYDGRDFLTTAWWLTTFPGICIMATALCLNFIGDGLRDALDPHLRNIT